MYVEGKINNIKTNYKTILKTPISFKEKYIRFLKFALNKTVIK